jgi:multicomponent Na+:H+ antiporter subunit D
MPYAGLVFLLGALVLAEVPPCGSFLGKALVEESADRLGSPWIAGVFFVSTVLTGGAVLRATARVFLGWGPPAERQDAPSRTEEREETPETAEAGGRTPLVMAAPALVLILLACLSGLPAHLHQDAVPAAARFEDRAAYASHTLGLPVAGAAPRADMSGPPFTSDLYDIATVFATIGLALLALYRQRLPLTVRHGLRCVVAPPITALRALHDGHIGDYVLWLSLGVTAFGALCAATMR